MAAPFLLLDPERLDALVAGPVLLDRDDATHLTKVLRARPGDPLELTDGAGRVVAGQLATGGRVEATGDITRVAPPRGHLELVQAMPKGRKLDEVVRAAVELGVDRLTVLAAERSVTQLDGGRADKAGERWAAVARSAVNQSRRAWAPELVGPSSLAEFLATRADGDGREQHLGVVAHVGAEHGLADVLAATSGPARDTSGTPGTSTSGPTGAIGLIGPESGWSEREITKFAKVGIAAAHLGPGVLRTEHAGLVLCGVLAFRLGRMGRSDPGEPAA